MADPSASSGSSTSESTDTRPFLCGDALEVDASGRATLIGGRCADCGTEIFPRVPVCASCMSENIKAHTMPGAGTLYAFSIVHVAAKKWRKPMRIGYVDLPNGARVFTHLEGADLAIGDSVEVSVGIIGDDDEGPIRSFVFRKAAR
jgi:uncharacterized OB-fold protein